MSLNEHQNHVQVLPDYRPHSTVHFRSLSLVDIIIAYQIFKRSSVIRFQSIWDDGVDAFAVPEFLDMPLLTRVKGPGIWIVARESGFLFVY